MTTTTNYVVTIQQATAVSAVATGYFTSSTELNLIVAKNTHFEIYLSGTDGLKLVKDVPIYGGITILQCFRLENMNKDVIFILTEKYHAMILDCRKIEINQYEIITLSHGLLKDTARPPSARPPVCTIDTKNGLILLRTVDGMVKLLHLKDLSSKNFEKSDLKIEEVNLIDMKFFSGFNRPVFVVLSSTKPDVYYKNGGQIEEYVLRAYQIQTDDFELIPLPWKRTVLVSEAHLIIPIGRETFSCLVLGRNEIAFYRENEQVVELESTLLDEKSEIDAYYPMDKEGQRYLLSAHGRLHQLILENDSQNKASIKMKLQFLGETSISRSLATLDHNLVFIGSAFGDSQLIRLSPVSTQNGASLELIETYTNVGPIVDMCTIDLERQNRELVTCSGAAQDASLRFIRTGIGIHEYASIDLRNIKGIWSLKIDNQYDNHLVVAFFDQTRLFQFQTDEIEEVELSAFDYQHQTLFCANIQSNQYLQITTYSIRLIGNNGRDLLMEWKNENQEITVGACNLNQCVCAIGNELFYFEIGDKTLNEISRSKLPHNIACLDITPWNSEQERTDLCAIGLWTQISVWICRLPTLDVLHKEPLTADTLPRSVVMITFDDQPYVVISLADGPIVYYSLDTERGFLYERRKVPLGTKPTTLTICQHPDLSSTPSSPSLRRVLLACSDRPSVISSSNGKLLFSPVNLREIICMCSFNSEFYGPSLTLVTDTGVILGRIDDLQKLHVRSLNLAESAQRLIYLEDERAFVILTTSMKRSSNDSITSISQQAQQKLDFGTPHRTGDQHWASDIQSSVVILDQHTHEARVSIQLRPDEEARSVCTVTFTEDPSNLYIAVGTVIGVEFDSEPIGGRLILLRCKNSQATIISEKQIHNVPHQLVAFQGQLLAAIGNTIRLFNFSADKQELSQICKHDGHSVECLQLKIKDDFILFGDLINSLTVLRYNAQEAKFERIAHNPQPVWMVACEFLDDETFLCSTDEGNLITYQKNSGSTKEQERDILSESGHWHIGEQINVFRHGCLICPQSSETTISLQSCTLMGSVSGYIGLTIQIPSNIAPLLTSLQKVLADSLPSIGNIEHSVWRCFEPDIRSNACRGFIDGDLIERYLDLPKTVQSELIKNLRGDNDSPLTTTVEDLVKIIEDLSRIH